MNELGKRISARLEAKGITQRELADMIGITEVFMSRIITGDRIPKAPIIANMAKALNCSINDLVGMESRMDATEAALLLATFRTGFCSDPDSRIAQALTLAIAALEQQEKDMWRPFRCRKTTEDDCSSFDYIMDCELPEDGQEILITVNNNGHEPVQMDTFFGGGGEECALDSGYDLCDEAVAWRPLPEPYREDKE